MQDTPAHYVSPLIYDKPIQESLHSDRRGEFVNEHTAQDGEQSATKQLVKRNSFSSVLPSKHRPPSISRYPEAPDVSRPLPVSPAQGTSYVDVIENLLRPLTRFTELLNGTPSNSTLYTTQEGKY